MQLLSIKFQPLLVSDESPPHIVGADVVGELVGFADGAKVGMAVGALVGLNGVGGGDVDTTPADEDCRRREVPYVEFRCAVIPARSKTISGVVSLK